MRPNRVAFQTDMASERTSANLQASMYAGHNELVRYHQEEYLDLPGLFRPNILGRLSLLIVKLLEFIHQYVPNWGLSIIVLTLMFRALVWPLITTQTKSMFGMQRLQPKLQELQRKYKDDREKLTQETMALYREQKVNPMSSCLPMLIQIPVFIALFTVLRSAVELRFAQPIGDPGGEFAHAPDVLAGHTELHRVAHRRAVLQPGHAQLQLGEARHHLVEQPAA